MKIILPILVLVLGSILATVGALFKIMHWPCSRAAMIAGLAVTLAGLCLLLIRLRNNRNTNNG